MREENTLSALLLDPSRRVAVILGAVVASIIFALIIGGMVASFSNDSDEADSSVQPSAAETKPARPEFPELPDGAEPVNEAARNNEPSGNFNNVWRGTPGTSVDFALAVRETYVRQYLETGEFDGTITVFSPVVQRNFTLSCSDNDAFVTCALGKDVVVYIA